MNSYTLNAVYFYLTSGCNLSCIHCYQNPAYLENARNKALLSVETFRKVIQQGKQMGLTSVKLTGGEPLFHPEIKEILHIVKQEELCLIIETNGVLCSKEIALQISTCKVHDKKPFVSISLDSHKKEVHEYIRAVPGCYEKALQGIENLVKTGIKPQIIMSLMQCNKNDVEGLVELAERIGASSVKFNLVQTIGRGEKLHENNQALNITEYIQLGEHIERQMAPKTKLRLFYGWPPAFRALGQMNSEEVRNNCRHCNILGIIGVLADGSYAMCGVSTQEKELIFGNSAIDDLAKIWDENLILNELREGIPSKLSGVCQVCLHKNNCFGNCVAHNYSKSRDLFAPFWFCAEAEKMGIFPKSRLLIKQV